MLVTLIRSYKDKLAFFGTLNIRFFVTIALLISHILQDFPSVNSFIELMGYYKIKIKIKNNKINIFHS